MHPATTQLSHATQGDLADALDQGAIGLAEAIAIDFSGKLPVAPAGPQRAVSWLRWFRMPAWAAGSLNGIGLRAAAGETAG